ncbi:hypothetical protein SELMODRAFT_423201 [Selaginella moellendorffii]|uniref:Uncharacterized protein n=1 Tax=Selaginella moellendorffii TaxID=88036 RepID=D8SKW8_SELML|nr:hypothetical protein SELMODRAFT_423201 [Selaginella moellendorffii]
MGLGPSIVVLSCGEEPSIPLQFLARLARKTTTLADLLQVGSTYGGEDFLELAEILRMRSDDLPSHFIVKCILNSVKAVVASGHSPNHEYVGRFVIFAGTKGSQTSLDLLKSLEVFSSGANVIVYHPNAALCNVVELEVSGVSHAQFMRRLTNVRRAVTAMFSSCERQHTCSGDSDGYNAGVSLVKQAFEVGDHI